MRFKSLENQKLGFNEGVLKGSKENFREDSRVFERIPIRIMRDFGYTEIFEIEIFLEEGNN